MSTAHRPIYRVLVVGERPKSFSQFDRAIHAAVDGARRNGKAYLVRIADGPTGDPVAKVEFTRDETGVVFAKNVFGEVT